MRQPQAQPAYARSPRTDTTLDVVRRPGPVPVLAVTGELDLATAEDFRRQLCEELTRCAGPAGRAALVVDLSRLRFLGVEGARVLRDVLQLAETCRVAVALVGLSPLARCAGYAVGLPLPAVAHPTAQDALRHLLTTGPPG